MGTILITHRLLFITIELVHKYTFEDLKAIINLIINSIMITFYINKYFPRMY